MENAINNEWGLFFGEKNKDLKKHLFAHIEKCLDEHFGVSKSFSNKTSQVVNNEVNYKGDSYSVSRQSGILTIKNMRTGKISKIDKNTMFEDLSLEQKSRMRRIFEELPGEVLADLAVECKKIKNGLDHTIERGAAFYSSKKDDITIKQMATLFVQKTLYTKSDMLLIT